MSELSLKTQHMLLLHSLIERRMKGQTHVLLKYDESQKCLWMAPGTDAAFKANYKAAPHILKDRNLKGDKSIAIHEILIDHALNETDRPLSFTEENGVLKIEL